jgi:hypothetical protein
MDVMPRSVGGIEADLNNVPLEISRSDHIRSQGRIIAVAECLMPPDTTYPTDHTNLPQPPDAAIRQVGITEDEII